MQKSLAILMTVFNRKDYTIRCLHQIFQQDVLENMEISIFIVDGGSKDGTVEYVKEMFPSVNIKVKEGVFWNRGMYAAWQWAVEKKVFDYYLWLNDDTFIYKECIETLIQESTKYNDNAIIIGATVDTNMKSMLTYGGRLSSGVIPSLGKSEEVHHFNGNIVLIPSLVYDKIGNLDFYYTHSKGDFDYGLRARKNNVKMYQAPNALGECDVHLRIDKWCDPSIPFSQRWEMLKRPNGMPPKESYHLNRKSSLWSAIYVYFAIYIRCLFPKLWIKLKSCICILP